MLTCRGCGQMASVDADAHPSGLVVCGRCDAVHLIPGTDVEGAGTPLGVTLTRYSGGVRWALQAQPASNTRASVTLSLHEGGRLEAMPAGLVFELGEVSAVFATMPREAGGGCCVVVWDRDRAAHVALGHLVDARAARWVAEQVHDALIRPSTTPVVRVSESPSQGALVVLGSRCAVCEATQQTTADDRARGWRVCGACSAVTSLDVHQEPIGWRMWLGVWRRARVTLRWASDGTLILDVVRSPGSSMRALRQAGKAFAWAAVAGVVAIVVAGSVGAAAWTPTVWGVVIGFGVVALAWAATQRRAVAIDAHALRWIHRPVPWGAPPALPRESVDDVVLRAVNGLRPETGMRVVAVVHGEDRVVVEVGSADEGFAVLGAIDQAMSGPQEHGGSTGARGTQIR